MGKRLHGLSWLQKSGLLSILATVCLSGLAWVLLVDKTLASQEVRISANTEKIDHNYLEFKDDLTDIRHTVHEINDRMGRHR